MKKISQFQLGLKSYFEVLKTYLTFNHTDETIVVICTNNDLARDKDRKWLVDNIEAPDDKEKSIFSDYLFILFHSGNKAVKFCNSVPHMFYSFVWENNEITHENS